LLSDVYEIIFKNNFHGVPVINGEKHLVGILTEYDLIVKDSLVHLPTFQKILSEIKIYKKGPNELKKEIGALKKLTAKDVMNPEPLVLSDEATLEEVVTAFREHHRVNPIPVIDKNRTVVGGVSRYDILKLFDFIKK